MEIPVSVKPEPDGRSGSGERCVPRSCGGDTTGRVPAAGAGGRRTMKNSAVVIGKGRKAGGQNMLILHGGHPARRCRRIEREGICYADALLLAPPTRL